MQDPPTEKGQSSKRPGCGSKSQGMKRQRFIPTTRSLCFIPQFHTLVSCPCFIPCFITLFRTCLIPRGRTVQTHVCCLCIIPLFHTLVSYPVSYLFHRMGCAPCCFEPPPCARRAAHKDLEAILAVSSDDGYGGGSKQPGAHPIL